MATKSTNKKIDRVLRNTSIISEDEAVFAHLVFASLLREAKAAGDEEPLPPDAFTPDKNKESFEKSLDPDADPNQFDVKDVPTININAEYISVAREWVDKLNEFTSFLNNSNDRDSLHRILADVDRAGSLFRGITRKTSDSIIRIAGEIERLKEVLNGFIIMAPKKLRDLDNARLS